MNEMEGEEDPDILLSLLECDEGDATSDHGVSSDDSECELEAHEDSSCPRKKRRLLSPQESTNGESGTPDEQDKVVTQKKAFQVISKTKPPSNFNIQDSEAQLVMQEKLSGLIVKNWQISQKALESLYAHYPFVHLQCVFTHDPKATQKWMIIGVIQSVSLSHTTTNRQSKYIVWKLTDLFGTVVPMVLFGSCYDAHWKQYQGAVVAVLSPNIQNTSLQVSQAPQVVHLGYLQDMQICCAIKKDGQPCTMLINAAQQYCLHHKNFYEKSRKSIKRAPLTTKPKMHKNSPPNFHRHANLVQFNSTKSLQLPHNSFNPSTPSKPLSSNSINPSQDNNSFYSPNNNSSFSYSPNKSAQSFKFSKNPSINSTINSSINPSTNSINLTNSSSNNPPNNPSNNSCYFMPNHANTKENSQTQSLLVQSTTPSPLKLLLHGIKQNTHAQQEQAHRDNIAKILSHTSNTPSKPSPLITKLMSHNTVKSAKNPQLSHINTNIIVKSSLPNSAITNPPPKVMQIPYHSKRIKTEAINNPHVDADQDSTGPVLGRGYHAGNMIDLDE
eukprot:Phypoly_transcript_06270.p1 GENE.Phypoly_transcript_06270~~Phypoly_transcript_06270.p1  ORF type:complete len:562 (+),score=80.73 Phypoly_transcript_06270:23-1687(+)